MKRISDWLMFAGFLLCLYVVHMWTGDAETGVPPGEFRWELFLAGGALLSAGWRLHLWQAIGDWRAWWQVPRKDRPEYHRRLAEARRREEP